MDINNQACHCKQKVSCCQEVIKEPNQKWIIGFQSTPMGMIPQVSVRLSFRDRMGSWKARWGIHRMFYRVQPGLYGVGHPDKDSHVLVTANYKMSFDRLRRELEGVNAWILVLDTKGINVWCAAGKGTFGTEELIRRISEVGLDRIVDHKTLILPQLGAPGVAAHQVQKATGFRVRYGPVFARDLVAFFDNNQETTKEMRRVSFTLKERMVLIPMELVHSFKIVPFAIILFGLINLIHGEIFFHAFFRNLYLVFIAILTGTVLVVLLLPWLPFRSFALKGWVLSLLVLFAGTVLLELSKTETMAYLLILPPVSSLLALLFTGSTPYTSLSGVQKEVLVAVPLLTVSVIGGLIFKIL